MISSSHNNKKWGKRGGLDGHQVAQIISILKKEKKSAVVATTLKY